MKLRLSIILLAAALAAAPAAGQTIKSLGFNTTNGNIVAATNVTFTNSVGFATNARAATRTNLELGATWLTNTNVNSFRTAINLGTNNDPRFAGLMITNVPSGSDFVSITPAGVIVSDGTTNSTGIAFGEVYFSGPAAAAATRTNLGLGATNNVTFSNITASGNIYAKDSTASPATNSSLARGIQWTNLAGFHAAIYGNYVGTPQLVIAAGASNSFSDIATFRATGMTVNSNAIVGGTLAVSNTATFSTNVTVNGNISVGSLTTTTPSTWALDATQTAAATNGILALPSNANVIRLTNSTAISGVSGGVLGAFYYLVNQATNAVTISNVGGITIDGAQNLTLSPNESATLVATGPTNVSVANRGDLNNVTLTGVDNLATQQTASSASSLMTRGLSDVRYLGEMWNASKMAAYSTTNPSVTVFMGEPMVTYTNLQPQGPFMQEFIPAEKYAGKTVKLLAYCRVNSTNGGNVQGGGRVIYLTNTAGGADPNYPLSLGGQSHGTVGVFDSVSTDVFPVATSTNQYLIFTSNVGTIPTNARMIVAAFGFNRASTNTTYTNNLYMHAVQLVVENP